MDPKLCRKCDESGGKKTCEVHPESPTTSSSGLESTERTAEIEKGMSEMSVRAEDEYHKNQEKLKMIIQHHVRKHGGDLSLLESRPIPEQVKCITLTNFGPSKNIHIFRTPLELPVRNEVIIRTYSCGVSFQDVMAYQGLLDTWTRSRKPPFTMGSELAGEIVGIGSHVTEFKVGDRVVALPEFQAWSEYAIVPAVYCYKIPENMNYHDAVAMAADGIVAYTLLFELGGLRPGKTILIHSAPGGLGQMVSQIAKTVSNVKVFNIAAGPPEDVEPSESSGLYTEGGTHYIDRGVDYASEIRHVSPMGVDLVLDCQCEDNFHKDYNLLKPLGKYILYGTQSAVSGESRGFFGTARAWWGMEKVSPLKLYEDNKTICGFNLRHLLYFQRQHEYIRAVLDKVFGLWQTGAIKPVFDCVLHLNDYAEGLQRMQDHGQIGKILLDPTMSKEDSYHKRDYLIPRKEIHQKHDLQEESMRSPQEMGHKGYQEGETGSKSRSQGLIQEVVSLVAKVDDKDSKAEGPSIYDRMKEQFTGHPTENQEKKEELCGGECEKPQTTKLEDVQMTGSEKPEDQLKIAESHQISPPAKEIAEENIEKKHGFIESLRETFTGSPRNE